MIALALVVVSCATRGDGEEACVDDVYSIGFDEAGELSDIDITICGDVPGGMIEGRVDTASFADTLTVGIVARSISDSALVYRASPGRDGGFEIGCVSPGRYSVEAFVDFNGNQSKDVEDTISIELADTLDVESCWRSLLVEFEFGHED